MPPRLRKELLLPRTGVPGVKVFYVSMYSSSWQKNVSGATWHVKQQAAVIEPTELRMQRSSCTAVVDQAGADHRQTPYFRGFHVLGIYLVYGFP